MGESLTLEPPASASDGSNPDDPGAPRVYSIIPDQTMLAADVLNIERQTMPYKNKETGEPVEKMVFKFKVTEPGEYEDRFLWGETSTSFVDHPGCRLRGWVSEIIGTDVLPAGFEVNTDDLLDAECRVIVTIREWTDKQTGELQQRNRVQDVLRSVASSSSPYDDPEPF